jgi:anti-anti-sigma regulatory factor
VEQPEEAVLTAKCCSWDREFLAVLSGSVAGDAAHDFSEILMLESWRELDRIALDLGEVTHVDLVGLAGLWRVAESQRAAGGTFEVQSLPPRIHRRFRAFGLTGRLDVGRPGEVRARLSHAPDHDL